MQNYQDHGSNGRGLKSADRGGVLIRESLAKGRFDDRNDRIMAEARSVSNLYPVSTPVSYTHLTLPTILLV